MTESIMPADPTDTRYYGGEGTIHSGGEVNVETDDDGNVVAVWFRCQPLRFTQSNRGERRAQEMRDMYAHNNMPAIDALVLKGDTP